MLNHLFSPFEINGKKLKNRTVVPAMAMNLCNPDGTCSERFISYFEAKAKGGFAMIFTDDCAVMPNGRAFVQIPGLWDDSQVEGFKEYTKRIHAQDSLAMVQLYHCGRQTMTQVANGLQPWSASAARDPFYGELPHKMTLEDIQTVVDAFGEAARRAEEAGFDGVEVHCYGYLMWEFLSTFINNRTDKYGGSLENRMRIVLEVLRKIRSKVSSDFIVGVRIGAMEGMDGGRTIEETKIMIPYLEAAGINYVNVTSGCSYASDKLVPSSYFSMGWLADYAKAIKEVATVPVIGGNRYTDMRVADQAIASGKADLIAFGRASIVDPEAPNKAREGRFEDIRTCIGCLKGCMGRIFMQGQGGCVLNPRTGNECDLPETVHAETPKKVMVIGAGPGGMAAAIEAAKAGHTVEVYEKTDRMGGQFFLASIPPYKSPIRDFVCWQTTQLEKLGVPIHLNTEVTEDLVKSAKPDVIVAATGAEPIIPPIPGIDSEKVVTARYLLEGNILPGRANVVIGGGAVGCETADYITAVGMGAQVTVVEMMDDVALDEGMTRGDLLADMEKHHVTILRKTTVKEITDEGVVVEGGMNGVIPADRVILAAGSKPDNALASKLKDAGYRVEVIGDAVEQGFVDKAIREGYLLGRSL